MSVWQLKSRYPAPNVPTVYSCSTIYVNAYQDTTKGFLGG
ncbi:uncharacterized protein FTOL_03081 [Fusarium torulosum]|uniref:Uncharacterized protein n=1 Tax=Fusarium torulosum TaxID=33205 RepID=A0AAE8SF85_9HYPO|nr:uncharacterized protein FTOL_03081 [Fusarium torulosum]